MRAAAGVLRTAGMRTCNWRFTTMASGTVRKASGWSWTTHQSIKRTAFSNSGNGFNVHANGTKNFSTDSSGGFFSGMKDRLTNKMDNKKKEKEEESYEVFVRQMLKTKKLTMPKYLLVLQGMLDEAGLNGWKKNIPGVDSQEGVVMIKKQIKIIESFDKKILADPSKITRVEKRRVASVTGEPVEAVNGIIRQYYELKMFHKWLSVRTAEGKPLPSSQTEAQKLFMQEGGIDQKLMIESLGGKKRMIKRLQSSMKRGGGVA
jgi:hypothetical protein